MSGQGIDTAVVGAGIMGASAAWQLARRGHRVALFEQYPVNHERGSSHGYTRIFREGYEEADYVRLARDVVPVWREAEEDLGLTLVRHTGILDVGRPEWVQSYMDGLDRAGVPYEWFDHGEAMRRFEGYRLPDGFGAMYQPDGGWIYAESARLGFVRRAEELGAEIHAETPVRGIRVSGERATLETENGTFEVDQVILTTAGWTNKLIEPLGLHVPVKVTREQVSFYPYQRPYTLIPSMWHVDPRTFLLFVLPNGKGGLCKVGLHNVGPDVDPDTQGEVDAERLDRTTQLVRERLPLLVPEPASSETCLYASTPDDDFVLDRLGPVILGFGFGSHGFKYGPLVGSFLADLVERKSIPLAHRFSYARFQRAPASMA